MDFILGPRADEIMTDCGAAYIPDDLAIALSRMTINDIPLTSESDREDHLIVEGMWFAGDPEGSLQRQAPLFATIFLVILIGALKINARKKGSISDNAPYSLYSIVRFVIAGSAMFLGLLLLMMWFLTDHSDTWANYNLLWTLPAFVFFLPNSLNIKKKLVAAATLVIAAYLLLSPWALPQFTSLSLWCASLAVVLSVAPQSLILSPTRS
jgi:hypothetical protein